MAQTYLAFFPNGTKMKIIKTIEYHKIINKNHDNHRISCENYENHEKSYSSTLEKKKS